MENAPYRLMFSGGSGMFIIYVRHTYYVVGELPGLCLVLISLFDNDYHLRID